MYKITRKILVSAIIALLFIPELMLGYTGEIVKSFNTPGKFPTGLTFDGKHLWLADRKADKLFCIDKDNGKVIRSIESPAYWPMGMAWDGEALWNVDIKGGLPLSENYASKIYKVDPIDGTLLKTINAPSDFIRGLSWDGNYFWCVDDSKNQIIKFSSDDGTTIRAFKSPSSHPQGLTFDGKYLWSSDRITNKIYMIDPESGCVIIIADAPGPYVRGLCFDGEFLWAVDYQNNKIYKLKINDNELYRKSNEHSSKVTFTYKIRNYGPGKVKDIDVFLALPVNRPNQTILKNPEYATKYSDVVTDNWGQKSIHYNFKNLKNGDTKEIQMTSFVKFNDVRYFIYPDKVGDIKDIPEDVKKMYLADNEKYDIYNPIIQKTVKKCVGDEKNLYWKARKIFNYLIDNMYYEMTGGWNTAPTVLARGNGSCSEYSFVYISMCRAAGIPARYVGAITERGDRVSMDDVFHRWVEIYLPNYGWVPVDPSGGDQSSPANQANYIGHVSNRFLITTQGGGSSTTLGWTYNCNEKWVTEPKTNIVIDYFADWQPLEE